MSTAMIRSLFEVALASITPPIQTAWENGDFKPTAGVPYQQAYLLLAQPDNPEFGPGYNQLGIFQVNLCYPQGDGWKPATDRADLIRDSFPRGSTLQAGNLIVTIIATPEIAPGRAEDDLYFVPVKVRWSAQFFGG